MGLGTISFEQEPIGDSTTLPVITNWTPLVPYVLQQTDISSLFYFKFILEIRIDDASGTLLGKIKQRPNGYSTGTSNVRAIFDVRDVVNSQLKDTTNDVGFTTGTIHKVGVNVATLPFSQNTDQVKTIYVKAYQQYSSIASAIPSEDTSATVNDTKRYIAASLPLETARGTVDFQNTAFSDFSLDGTSKRFLSDVQDSTIDFNRTASYISNLSLPAARINYIRHNDYHTVAFLNGEGDFASKCGKIMIKFYNSANSLLATEYIDNTNANGGAIPLTGTTEVNTDAERLIYFGCGPANLEGQSRNTDARPSAYPTYAYYTVRAVETNSGNPMSDNYYFFKQSASCKEFKMRRLAWRNSLGAYDYFNFKMKSMQTVEVSRNTFESMIGNFNSGTYSYYNTQRGKQVRKTSAILKETLNTEWISEEDATLLEGLIKSTNVEIIENSDTLYTVPVLITDTSFVRKTQVNDGMKIKYTINIEYANSLNTNS
jgi:hypothetical protein